MRTITTKLYKFSELSTKAQSRACDDYRERNPEYVWSSDAIKSLEAFASHFGARVNYSIDWGNCTYSHAQFRFQYDAPPEDEALANLVGELKHDGSCQFTGYCADDDCNEGAVKAWEAGERTAAGLLQAGFRSFLASAQADYKSLQTDEHVSESLIVNCYEFTENGKIYGGVE